MLKIALTGGIACGKSLVSAYLRDRGVPICDTDEVAHQLMGSGGPVVGDIVAAFGETVLGPDGAIDRTVLGAKVFSDSREREKLNAIVHPPIREHWRRWLECRADEGHRAAVVVIPLLFEGNPGKEWDCIVCVVSTRDLQLARLEGRGLNRQQAEQRIAAQMDNAEKAKRSDFVIHNNGSREALEMETDNTMTRILETA